MRKTNCTELDFESAWTCNKSDEEIAEEIRSALEWHVPFPAILTVSVQHGHVTLSGDAAWEYERQNIEKVVGGLRRVVGVTNLITVGLGGDNLTDPRETGTSNDPETGRRTPRADDHLHRG